MTLDQIVRAICTHFGISPEQLLSKNRKEEFTRARDIWRTIANIVFHYTPSDISKHESIYNGEEVKTQTRSAVYASVNRIIIDGQYKEEYDSALYKIRKLSPESPVEVNEMITDESGITRVTKEAFDERFYGYNDRLNPMSGNNWFPSWHFLYGIGSPTEDAIKTYYKNKGWASAHDFKRAQVVGTYVHNRIEEMGKYDIVTTTAQIYRAFPDPYEARKVEECLMAWINFVNEECPKVLAFEQMVIAKDWGGTVDLRARIKSDNYKDVWTIDFKTSKSVYESHKSQVESYRREFNDGRAAVLVLGNSTKKRYTFTEVKEKDRDFYYNDFVNIKKTAYDRLIKAKRLQPHVNDMPDVFTLKGLNIEKP